MLDLFYVMLCHFLSKILKATEGGQISIETCLENRNN